MDKETMEILSKSTFTFKISKLYRLVRWLNGKLICSWKGHSRGGSYDVFVVEKTIDIKGNHEIIDGRWPGALQSIAERYGDCGHIETIIYCKRCGFSFVKGSGGTIYIQTGEFEGDAY